MQTATFVILSGLARGKHTEPVESSPFIGGCAVNTMMKHMEINHINIKKDDIQKNAQTFSDFHDVTLRLSIHPSVHLSGGQVAEAAV